MPTLTDSLPKKNYERTTVCFYSIFEKWRGMKFQLLLLLGLWVFILGVGFMRSGMGINEMIDGGIGNRGAEASFFVLQEIEKRVFVRIDNVE